MRNSCGCAVTADQMIDIKIAHVLQCTSTVDAKKIVQAVKNHFNELSNVPLEPFKALPIDSTTESTNVVSALQSHYLDRTRLTSKNVLGAGHFGEVWLASWDKEDESKTEHSIDVAVKILRKGASENERLSFQRECLAMAELCTGMSNAHVCRMVGLDLSATPQLLVLEFVKYGDLQNILIRCRDRNTELTNAERLSFLVQISAGMKYISSKSFVHLDVAARNMLVGPDNEVKIADFGLARCTGSTDALILTEKLKLPMRWMAPEAMDVRKFSIQSDVWAFAVTAWEVFSCGETPFDGLTSAAIQNGVREGLRLSQPLRCPDMAWAILLDCWAKDRLNRPSFDHIHLEFSQLSKHATNIEPNLRDIGAMCVLQLHRRASTAGLEKYWGVEINSGSEPDKGETDNDEQFNCTYTADSASSGSISDHESEAESDDGTDTVTSPQRKVMSIDASTKAAESHVLFIAEPESLDIDDECRERESVGDLDDNSDIRITNINVTEDESNGVPKTATTSADGNENVSAKDASAAVDGMEVQDSTNRHSDQAVSEMNPPTTAIRGQNINDAAHIESPQASRHSLHDVSGYFGSGEQKSATVTISATDVGRRCIVKGYGEGTLEFFGPHHAKKTLRCGVALDIRGTGKNDGSVGGHVYFRCPADTGVLVVPTKVTLLDIDEEQDDAKKKICCFIQ